LKGVWTKTPYALQPESPLKGVWTIRGGREMSKSETKPEEPYRILREKLIKKPVEKRTEGKT
jgi:hypothetical protein